MGYCCGGIETKILFVIIFLFFFDHMGYCCGGIETVIAAFTVPFIVTTWVTAAAVLRLLFSYFSFF